MAKDDRYDIHDIRWAQLKSFTAGVVFACFALAGIVNLALALKDLLE